MAGVSQISLEKASGSLIEAAAAAAASPAAAHTTVFILAGKSSRTRQKRGETSVVLIVWMVYPTLVNKESPSTRIPESKDHFKIFKSQGKSENELQREPSSTPSAVRPLWVGWNSWLKNVRWRRLYIDRRTPLVAKYPAVSANKM